MFILHSINLNVVERTENKRRRDIGSRVEKWKWDRKCEMKVQICKTVSISSLDDYSEKRSEVIVADQLNHFKESDFWREEKKLKRDRKREREKDEEKKVKKVKKRKTRNKKISIEEESVLFPTPMYNHHSSA